jgi:inhibitor of the pro-sigma K processing machinery
MHTYIIIAVAALACGIIIVVIRNPDVLKKFIGSAVAGFAALAAINLTASLTGVGLAVSVWSIAAAGLLGLPGVVSMLMLKIFWGI